jgi:ankyrin repeat protein
VAEVRKLIAGVVNPNELDTAGFTALMRAARNGHVEVVRTLLKAGADPEMKDRAINGWTALIHATHKNQTETAIALLEGGANPDSRKPGRMTALIQAAGKGNVRLVRALLAHGANPRLAHTDGATPLLRAVSGGAISDIDNPLLGRCNCDVARALLEKDPTLKLPDNLEGRLALWFARFNKCRDVLDLIGEPH